jgi:hypothetical protein
MAEAYLHPEVESRFVEYDFRSVSGSDSERRALMADYADGALILLTNTGLWSDRRFLMTGEYKKLASRIVEEPTPLSRSLEKQALCRIAFGGNKRAFFAFESEVIRLNRDIRRVMDELLRDYAVMRSDIVWRLTETRVENLHLDIDRKTDTYESVRLYLNVDDAPRLWRTSHLLWRLLEEHPGEDASLEALLHRLSVEAFGGWETRGRETAPCHTFLFEPGDVWLCDGRVLSHQVLYGRRTVSTFYRLTLDGLPEWHRPLAERIPTLN